MRLAGVALGLAAAGLAAGGLGMADGALPQADGYRGIQFNAVVETNTAAVHLWQSLGFEILATVPGAFLSPTHGYVGLHVMFLGLD